MVVTMKMRFFAYHNFSINHLNMYRLQINTEHSPYPPYLTQQTRSVTVLNRDHEDRVCPSHFVHRPADHLHNRSSSWRIRCCHQIHIQQLPVLLFTCEGLQSWRETYARRKVQEILTNPFQSGWQFL